MDDLSTREAERLRELGSYGVLDSDAEPAFDRVTALAASVFDVPIALVSLVDRDRQWFKSAVGLDGRETPREDAFCAHALELDSPLVVPDALEDPRFRDNRLVTGAPHIRFYAGAPLRTPRGFALGTLCVIDRVPRTWDERSSQRLMALAAVVVDALELRVRTRQLDYSRIALQRASTELTTILDGMDEVVVAIDRDHRTIMFNRAAQENLGSASRSRDPADWVASTQVFLPDEETPFPPAELPIIRALSGEVIRGEILFVRTAGGEQRWHSVNASPLRGGDGDVVGAVSVGRDITEERELARRLADVALYDELTGVLNRRGLLKLGGQALALARRKGRPMLALFFDLDGLKPINDRFGHAEGDRLIRDATQVIVRALREVDLVARVGGDELVALCVETSAADAAVVLARLDEARVAANAEVRPAPIAWSVGQAMYTAEEPHTLEELLALADQAMYVQKQARRGGG